MDIARKLEMFLANVRSVADHHDEPADEVVAALDAMIGIVEEAKKTLPARRKAYLEARKADAAAAAELKAKASTAPSVQ